MSEQHHTEPHKNAHARIENLSGGVAIVTGGASGIGYALVEAAVTRGMHGVIADIETEAIRVENAFAKPSRRNRNNLVAGRYLLRTGRLWRHQTRVRRTNRGPLQRGSRRTFRARPMSQRSRYKHRYIRTEPARTLWRYRQRSSAK